MNRKDFIHRTTLGSLASTLPLSFWFNSCTEIPKETHSLAYKTLVENLLKEWCDGMMAVQVIDPSNSKIHGMLTCPACDEIHARSMDAVYPFFYLAKSTGEQKYLEAGIALFEWSANVTNPDGSWTNTLDPKSWNGITVFGAISLAEALHYHGDLLDADRLKKWTDRLEKAADFLYRRFPAIDTTNVNYGATTIYALHLLGSVLKKPEYLTQSKKLAKDVKAYFTENNTFLFGEVKPTAHKRSKKGLYGVDLGYNVEESLNSLVLYALYEKDTELLDILQKSLNTHLAFMLPDGGWDNGWGTRMYKWTYWGSRTCDGSQPAFGMMAKYNPAFGTAAIKNTELLQRCTHNGLLHGGPNYVTHDIKPCVHHTFEHAKPLAALLDHWEQLPNINTDTPLPRTVAQGIQHYKDIDTTLFASGDWRGTVTAYDAIYKDGDYRQATGGALSMLYHTKLGLLVAASMAIYKMVEVYNQQPNPDEDFPLTPRVETYSEGQWYSNLFDREATLSSEESADVLKISAQTRLKNENNELVEKTASDFNIDYHCSAKSLQIKVQTAQPLTQKTAFVFPVISPTGEKVNQINPYTITIQKPEGLVQIVANVPLVIKETKKERVFNMVPGAEAVPMIAYFLENTDSVELSISVSS